MAIGHKYEIALKNIATNKLAIFSNILFAIANILFCVHSFRLKPRQIYNFFQSYQNISLIRNLFPVLFFDKLKIVMKSEGY